MYIRYETDIKLKTGILGKGVFAAMGDLKRRSVMTNEETFWYQQVATWFNERLQNPDCFELPVDTPISNIAKSWFSPDALEFIDKTESVALLLQRYGIGVEKLTSNDPGKVIYKDINQVVVLPYENEKILNKVKNCRSLRSLGRANSARPF